MKSKIQPRYIALGALLCGFGGALYLAAQPRLRAVQTKNCQINLKIIGLAMMQYVDDYDEHYPIAANWADSLKPYAIGSELYAVGSSDPRPNEKFDKIFHCPTTDNFYSYNRNLGAVSMETLVGSDNQMPTDLPLVIEVAAGQTQTNLNGGAELWPSSLIHETAGASGNHVLFADGHVELTKIKPNFRAFTAPTPKPAEIKPARTATP